jgi:hypothetical protein
MNSIIDNQLDHFPDAKEKVETRPQPIILTKEEREKAMQRCGYELGLRKGVAREIAMCEAGRSYLYFN